MKEEGEQFKEVKGLGSGLGVQKLVGRGEHKQDVMKTL